MFANVRSDERHVLFPRRSQTHRSQGWTSASILSGRGECVAIVCDLCSRTEVVKVGTSTGARARAHMNAYTERENSPRRSGLRGNIGSPSLRERATYRIRAAVGQRNLGANAGSWKVRWRCCGELPYSHSRFCCALRWACGSNFPHAA
jgi:hypothetical protein